MKLRFWSSFLAAAVLCAATANAQPAPPAPPPAPPDAETEEEEEPEPAPQPQPQPRPQQPPAPTSPAGPGFGPMPMFPEPKSDAKALEKQGDQRPGAKQERPGEDRVYAEDWWSHARPILELHGYYRLRAELFHNFSLGRIDAPGQAIWPMPADNHYVGKGNNVYGPALCTEDESEESGGTNDDARNARFPCKNKTQAGANMRFRLNPELHISDNLRIVSQIDLLDNLVLGSTPEGYSNEPGQNGGYRAVPRGGYTPLGAFESTQVPPSGGRNSFKDSVQVKRVWAEYLTPVGQLRFGRMPSHWGLGILANAGDGYDDDYQSTVDRIMFVTGLKSLDLYFAAAWDFTNEGPTSESHALPQGQPYDLAQLDDVDQYVFVIVRRKSAELTKLALAQGDVVLNAGAYVVHRRQLLAADQAGAAGCAEGPALGCDSEAIGRRYIRRGASAWIPDLWVQLLYKKFRFELEAVTIQGSIENVGFSDTGMERAPGNEDWKIRQYGLAGEIEQKLVEDRLRLKFMSGWASGDPEASDLSRTNSLSPLPQGFQPQLGDDTISTFRFHPAYRVDLILWRNIMTRVQGAYYFRPSIEYDFVREENGQRFGGGFAAIWSRATQFIQTPGHERDLGVELNLSLYYQSKDGAQNDDPDKMGGFYTMLQYGVLFPMAGLGYQEEEARAIARDLGGGVPDTSTAQILRWYLGVFF
jgi:uncharacterized protein (TIGR04551 family)